MVPHSGSIKNGLHAASYDRNIGEPYKLLGPLVPYAPLPKKEKEEGGRKEGGRERGRFTIYRQAHDWHKQSEPT